MTTTDACDAIPEVEDHRDSYQVDRAEYWRRLRALGPVVKVADHYLLTRCDDILQAARDPKTFATNWPALPVVTASGPLPRVPLSCPPHEHLKFARILHRLFAPSAIAPYEDAIRAQAAALIGSVAITGHCDVTGSLAYLWPCQAFVTVMGLPRSHTAPITALMQADEDGDTQMELLNLLSPIIAEGFGRHLPGLLWRLLADLDQGDFTVEEILGLLLVVFGGAAAAVTDAIGYALWRLACHPLQRAQLRGNPQQIEAFVDEILRLHVGSKMPRITTCSVTIAGHTIEPGTEIRLPLECANRENSGDEMQTDNDGQVRAARHASFGAGPYRCPAAPLARMELKLFLDEWLRQIPEFDVEPADFTPVVGRGLTLASLPLRWSP